MPRKLNLRFRIVDSVQGGSFDSVQGCEIDGAGRVLLFSPAGSDEQDPACARRHGSPGRAHASACARLSR
jgi:hypothetical protein